MKYSSRLRQLLPALRWQGLTFQLFVFIVLPIGVLLVVIAFGSLALHGHAMRVLVGERDERTAQSAAVAIAEQLGHRAAAIRGLANYAGRTLPAFASPSQTLTDYDFLLPDFEGGLMLAAEDGTVLASSGNPGAWRSRPVAALLSQARVHGEPVFSSVFIEDDTHEPMMLVMARAADEWVTAGAFEPAHLAQRALGDGFSSSGQAFVMLVDSQRQVLFQAGTPPASEFDLVHHPGVAEALGGETGTIYLPTEEGEHVVAYAPVASVGWALILEEPWESVDSPLLRQTQAAPLVLLPLLVFALIALGFGIRQIVQPLQRLAEKAAALGWGHYDAIEPPVGGIAEIRHLQAQLVLMAHKVKTAQENLRGYLNAITAGQEDERRRLARELHDGAVQSLVALDQRAQLAQMALKGGSHDVEKQLAELRQMTASLIDEVRRVIHALRPNYLEDLGLLPAIEMLTRDLQTSAGLTATFSTRGEPRRLPAAQEIGIFRIVQEALSNAVRHAAAQTVSVAMVFHSAGLTVRVQDDGRGFAAPERVSDLVAASHYGLIGMQERAELIGGRLAIQSSPDSGTTIELHLPF